MAFNYVSLGSQAMENMLPLFSAMSNGGQSNPLSYPAFSQFGRALRATAGDNANVATTSNASHTPTTAAAVISAASIPKRDHGVTTTTSTTQMKYNPTVARVKPNQGAAPMDLDTDLDIETSSTTNPTPNLNTTPKSSDKMPISMHDANLFLNGLMSPALNAASSYMFFPSGNPAAQASASTATATQMLMDPTGMMAAAMTRIQQNFAGYAVPESEGNTNVSVAVAPGTASTTISAPSCTSASLTGSENFSGGSAKEVIKTKSCILFPPNPNAPPPTIRDRPPGCRTVFVGGLPENISEEIIREIFESCGEITTLRMSKKNFCHIRYRLESSIDRAIYLSGYRVRILNSNDPTIFGRLHVDYAQARDDQYDYECKQRQLQRELRHRERISLDRTRSQSPPPMPHYTDHEASLVSEKLRNNETFLKAVQTITVWLERGDCNKRNANIFYSMIQITHGHVRHLHADKQQLEDDLRKARENYRKQMGNMSTQFTQIEKVFNAASHKKVWDHFTKAQRKNIDQWKKLASELRSIQIEDDEMEMSDEDREYQSNTVKRARYDSENLKDENDSLRCQLEAIRNEMSLERTDLKYNSDFREKQIKVLQETIRNMQTQLLNTKLQEQRDARNIETLEQKLKEAKVKQLLLKTKIKETFMRLKDKDRDKEMSSMISEISEEDTFAVKKTTELQHPHDAKENNYSNNMKPINIASNIDLDRNARDEGHGEATVVVDHVDNIVEESKPNTEIAQKISTTRAPATTKRVEQEEHPIIEQNITKHTISNIKSQQEMEQILNTPTSSFSLLEGRIIALTATFLVVQPQGVTIDVICNHLSDMIKSTTLQPATLERILHKYLNVFKAEPAASTAESGMVRKWTFCGFTESL